MTWKDDQEWERQWHAECANSYWEETKQIVYARKMGIVAEKINGKYPVYDLKGQSIIDVGAGPYSMLLKTVNGGGLCAVDPCDYPEWTVDRYRSKHIKVIKEAGEDFTGFFGKIYDEAWIYNCLQHTKNPNKIIKNMRSYSKIIRIFEWIEEPISIGHPQLLTEEKLNKWLGGVGKVEQLAESGCYGKAYYGVFLGDHYGDSN